MRPLFNAPVRNKNSRERHFKKQAREYLEEQAKKYKQQREERKRDEQRKVGDTDTDSQLHRVLSSN
jgi:hypothetical protein